MSSGSYNLSSATTGSYYSCVSQVTIGKPLSHVLMKIIITCKRLGCGAEKGVENVKTLTFIFRIRALACGLNLLGRPLVDHYYFCIEMVGANVVQRDLKNLGFPNSPSFAFSFICLSPVLLCT